MAAPTSIWEWKKNIYGLTTPATATFEATSSLETLAGTLLFMSSGQVDNGGDGFASCLGLAVGPTSAAATAGDAVEVEILRPGDVIRGTADADASTLSGFNGKKSDLNANGTLDFADTTNGCLSVMSTKNSGLTVDCVITEFDHGSVN